MILDWEKKLITCAEELLRLESIRFLRHRCQHSTKSRSKLASNFEQQQLFLHEWSRITSTVRCIRIFNERIHNRRLCSSFNLWRLFYRTNLTNALASELRQMKSAAQLFLKWYHVAKHNHRSRTPYCCSRESVTPWINELVNLGLILQVSSKGVIVEHVSEDREDSVIGLIKPMDVILGIEEEINSEFCFNLCHGSERALRKVIVGREGKKMVIFLRLDCFERKISSAPQMTKSSGICQIVGGHFPLFEIDVPDIVFEDSKDHGKDLRWLRTNRLGQNQITAHNTVCGTTSVDVQSFCNGCDRLVSTVWDNLNENASTSMQSHSAIDSLARTSILFKVSDLCQNLSEAGDIISSLLVDSAACREWSACLLINCNHASRTALKNMGKAKQSLQAQQMQIATKYLQQIVRRKKICLSFKAWKTFSVTAHDDQKALIDGELQARLGEVKAKLVEKDLEAQKCKDERDYYKSKLSHALKVLGRSELLHL